uniref:HAT C-terminal dimerisation domain-containing protein n=1 Tax=Quercus lobata TaxID=97700 RepID=A0A7N2RC21_QUELO
MVEINWDLSGYVVVNEKLPNYVVSDLTDFKSQLDLYLEETRLDHRLREDLNVMGYWKSHSNHFPELSLMARDILSIPITTIASEFAFNIGGCILNKFRSSLLPQIAEALLCARDWLYGVPIVHDFEEESLVEDFGNLCLSQSSSNVAAGAIYSTATFPLEVARKHMQATGAINGRQYQSMLHALVSIFENEGLPGLYRGLGPSCVKLVPTARISFMCYEACKRILVEKEEDD